MEFRDLKQQYQIHREEINSAVQAVLDNTDFINGRQVMQLENRLKEYVDVKYCITCANGTDALQLALLAWQIGKNDAVFVPDFTFFSSGEVVPLVGATPVFVDVERETYNMDPESLEQAICYVLEKTDLNPRVVIAVDLFGQPAEYNKIRQIADKYNLFILEDAAQGFGGRIGDKRACSFGDIATTSFFPAKPLGCYGDGGAIFTNNDEWAGLIKSYKVHGKGMDKYDNIRIGMNSRLDTLQAAVLLEKLNFFDSEIEKCNQIAEEYTRNLHDRVRTPVVKEGMYSSWAQYTICFHDKSERERAIQILNKNSVPSAIYYKKPMHKQEAFSKIGLKKLSCDVTDEICDCCLSLPMHPYLSMDDVCHVVNSILL